MRGWLTRLIALILLFMIASLRSGIASPQQNSVSATPLCAAVTLNWTSNGAPSYSIYRSTNASGPFSVIGTATTNAYGDLSCDYSSSYYYSVSSNNADGSTTLIGTASATTLPAQFNLTARTLGTTVRLSWPQAVGPVYVMRASSATGTYACNNGNPGTVGNSSNSTPPYLTTPTSFIDGTTPNVGNGPTYGTTYFYRLYTLSGGWLTPPASAQPGLTSVPAQISGSFAPGFLRDAMTLPGWMSSVIPVDQGSSSATGPAAGISVNLAHGTVDVCSNTDLSVDNPTGDPVIFERSYRTPLAAAGLSSPGLGLGWTHNWDYHLVPLGYGTVFFVYPNGAGEIIGVGKTPPGAPYIVWELTPTTVILKENGLASQTFTLAPGDTVYRLTKQTFPNGSSLLFTYSNGCLTNITDSSNTVQLNLTYDPSSGLLSEALDAQTGNCRTYAYSNGNLIGVSNLSDSHPEWNYGYQTVGGANFINSVVTTDPFGNVTTASIAYDPATGRATQTTDSNGNVRSLSYNDAGSATANITPPSTSLTNPTSYPVGFDSTGRQTSITNAAGDITTFTYSINDLSLVTSIQRPMGNPLTVQDDAHGNPTKITYPYGNSTVYTWAYPSYAPLGQITSATDYGADGTSKPPTLYTYNGQTGATGPLNSIQSVQYPNGGIYTYTYTSLGDLDSIATPNGHLTYSYITYNANGTVAQPERFGKPVAIDDGQGKPVQFNYDAAGRITAVSDRLGNVSTAAFNQYDDLVSATLPMQRQLQVGFATPGKEPTSVSISSPNQSAQTDTLGYDSESSFKNLTDPNSNTTTVGYDSDYNLAQITNANRQVVHQFIQSPATRTLQTIFGNGPKSLTLTAIANRNGDPISVSGTDNRFTTINQLNQDPSFPISVTTTNKGLDSQEGKSASSYTYDGFGRVSSITTGSSHGSASILHAFYYDDEDNLIEKDLNGTPEVIYSYNLDRSRKTMLVPASSATVPQTRFLLYQYAYDSFARLISITVNYANEYELPIAAPAVAYANYTYDANGRVVAMRTPKADVFYTYDALGEITSISNVTPDGAPDPNAAAQYHFTDPFNGSAHTILASFSNLTYDQLGDLLTSSYVAESVHGSGASVFLSGGVTYTYDNAGRLASESWQGGPTYSYAFDKADNLVTLRNKAWTVDPSSDELTGSASVPGYQSPKFDASGDLTGFTAEVSYDSLGQPYAIATASSLLGTSLNSATYLPLYDESGRRYTQTIQTVTQTGSENFFYDGDELVYRSFDFGSISITDTNGLSDLSGSSTVYYLWGPTGVAMEFDNAGNNRTFLFDPSGNCVATSNGLITNPMFFDAYGLSIVSYKNDYRAIQQPFQYKGQFGYHLDGFSGLYYCKNRYYDPQSGRWLTRDPIGSKGGVNVYEYCNANPIRYCDPTGLQERGEPGFWEDLIPIWGPAKRSENDFNHGRFGWAIFNGLLAVSDFCFVRDLVTIPIRLTGAAAKEAVEVGSHAIEAGAEAEAHVLASSLTGIKRSSAIGRFGEEFVRRVKDIGPRKLLYYGTGGAYVIADGAKDVIVTEVKNVAKLSLTIQMRGYLQYLAEHPGSTLELWVRVDHGSKIGTHITGPLQKYIDSGTIKLIKAIPWPK